MKPNHEFLEQAAAYVLSHWRYDPETGDVLGRGNKPIGVLRRDGALNATVHVATKRSGTILLHRAIWLLQTGGWPAFEIDHINGKRTDNRWVNLRLATKSQNQQNRRPISERGDLIGCTPHFNKWKAQIRANGKVHYIGLFPTQEEAHAAYCEAKTRLHDFNPTQRRT